MNENVKTNVVDVDAKKAKTQKILSVIIIVVIALMVPVLVINITLLIKSWVNPDVPPTLFGNITLFVDEAMDPDIKKGDMVFIKACEPEDIEIDDYLLYKTNKGYVLQKVDMIYKASDGEVAGWYTSSNLDSTLGGNTVPASNLIGKYEGGRISSLGAIASFMGSIWGIIICMAIPLGLLVAYEVVTAKKKEKASDNEKSELLAELEALRKAKAEAEASKTDEVVEAPAAPAEETEETVEAPETEVNAANTPAEAEASAEETQAE